MTAAHEPTIHYLDSILNEEEKRCGDQYSHQWRNFTISRSGRFRSKNKKRDVVDGKLFDGKENDKVSPVRAAPSNPIFIFIRIFNFICDFSPYQQTLRK